MVGDEKEGRWRIIPWMIYFVHTSYELRLHGTFSKYALFIALIDNLIEFFIVVIFVCFSN